MHQALLVTGIPEGLERKAIEGIFRLCNTGAAKDHKAKAAWWSSWRT